ncbi:MAG: EamA family transporter [Candidatus Binatia bacterium]
MTGAAISLVLLSALLHATWNFFSKGSRDRWAFFFGQGLATAVFYAPAFIWLWSDASIDRAGWLYVGASAVTHAGYAVYLLKSYDAGDLSVAYPLSRTAPILLVVWDVFAAPARLRMSGIAGAVLAGAGALVLQLPALRRHGGRAVLGQRVTRYALLTAVFVATFTIVDQQGVVRVPPFIFLYLVAIGEFCLIGIYVGRDAASRVADELRHNARAVLFTALVGPFSYLLILWVLATAPASYVLGLRQTSIVFGVLLGRLFLGEGETRYRLAGAAIIAAGSVLIATAG